MSEPTVELRVYGPSNGWVQRVRLSWHTARLVWAALGKPKYQMEED